MTVEHGSGAVDSFKIDREHFVHEAQKCIEGRLDGVAPIDRGVPVQNFLQDLGIRHQTFLIGDATLEKLLSLALVRVHTTHEIHGNVGVYEDHP